MSKWKCEICGNEFENFHAQGFDNKIYCPLCYFKKENQKLETEKEQLNSLVNSCQEEIRQLKKQLKEYKLITIDYQELEARNKELKKQIQERPKEYVFIGNAQNKTRDFINQITKDNKEFKNQQKEFINYLTSYIELLNNKPDLIEEGQQDILKEVFDKFKEIIGNDINVLTKGVEDVKK